MLEKQVICLYIKVNPQYLLQRLLKLQPPQQPQRLLLLVKSDLVNSGLADAAGIDDGGGDVRPPQRLRHIELKSGKKLHLDRKKMHFYNCLLLWLA